MRPLFRFSKSSLKDFGTNLASAMKSSDQDLKDRKAKKLPWQRIAVIISLIENQIGLIK